MTYNWNNMVDITVPTGTNGWLYSGEVTINGVKVRFPVGVPTSVPEPAAALLNKMIELEQEDANNTAKPDNHYVGSVTIPEGKILKLEKGAKVEDPEGILGGAPSAPAEVVILPETDIADTGDGFYLFAKPSVTPTDGAMCKVTYNGTAYDCPAMLMNLQGTMPAYIFGNTEVMGLPGGNADAPFVFSLIPGGVGTPEDGYFYGVVEPMDGAESVTLSIVQVGGAASGGGSASASGGVVYVTVTTSDEQIPIEDPELSSMFQLMIPVVDTSSSLDEIENMVKEGKNVIAKAHLSLIGGYVFLPIVSMNDDGAITFSMYMSGASYLLSATPDGWTLMFGMKS